MRQALQSGQMDRGGNDVITGLAAIDMVIGVHRFVAAFTSENFGGTIGDDLVGIHVG